MNKVILIGWIEEEPDVRYFNANHVRTYIKVRTEEHPTNPNAEQSLITLRHNVVAWGDVAKLIEERIRPEMLVRVEGRLTYQRETDREGMTKTLAIIDCSSITTLEQSTSASRSSRDTRCASSEGSTQTNASAQPAMPSIDWQQFSPTQEEDPMA